MGKPAVFIRLALCNLRCDWCDTSYTWKWPVKESSKHVLSIPPEEVARIISDFPTRHIVITGGEPLIQSGKIIELLKYLPFHTLEVETNGTLIPPEELDCRVTQYNISPKHSHSGNSDRNALSVQALEWFAASSKAWFKFVIESPGDIEEVEKLEKSIPLPHDRILLMPKGTTSEELNRILPWLAEECLKRGYRLTDRLHIHLWGNKPGV